MSKSVSIAHNLYALLHVHNIQKLSSIRPAMLIQVLCKNELDVTYSALSTYFRRSQTHPLTVKHLLLVKRHSNLTRQHFTNLQYMVLVLRTDTFHVQLAVKCIFQRKLCLVKLLLAFHIHVWIYTSSPQKLKTPCKTLWFLHWSLITSKRPIYLRLMP